MIMTSTLWHTVQSAQSQSMVNYYNGAVDDAP